MSPSPPIVVVMGVSGSGKSTMGRLLAKRLGVDYRDGDEFHSPTAIAKMSSGLPLDDEDRAPWLQAMAAWIREVGGRGDGAVLACSALRRKYRDQLRASGGRLLFLHLDADPELIAQRISRRTDHFMPPALLASQFAALEPLATDEPGGRLDIKASPEAIVDRALAAIAAERQTE